MKIETKYNLGDKFYRMEGNIPTEFEVVSVETRNDLENDTRAYYNLRYTDRYKVASTLTGVREDTLMEDYYRSKSALMLALFPNLFKEAKGVWLLNEEGGEQ